MSDASPTDHSLERPVSYRRRNSTQTERIASGIVFVITFALFSLVLIQNAELSALEKENEGLSRYISREANDAVVFQSALNVLQDEKRHRDERLTNYLTNLNTVNESLKRERNVTKEALTRAQKTQEALVKCEVNSKRKEAEFEARLAVVRQEKIELTKRVQNEHSLSEDWTKKYSTQKLAREDCQQRLGILQMRILTNSARTNETSRSSVQEQEHSIDVL